MKRFALCLAMFAVPVFAGAQSTPSPQTHHCVKNGATIEKKKKECKKEGGMWEKNAAKPASTPPPAK